MTKVETDIGKRWEAGTEHHRASLLLMSELKVVDKLNEYAAGDMTETGGDGDLGELLMYLMDVVFEQRDEIVDQVIERGHRCEHGTILCPKCHPREKKI